MWVKKGKTIEAIVIFIIYYIFHLAPLLFSFFQSKKTNNVIELDNCSNKNINKSI